MRIEPNTQLLHYQLIEKIGEGGMGAVWRARDTSLDRDIAIKVLPELMSDDPERLARFDREAKLLASLNHPNIAAIYGFHREGGTSFLALELVAGEDLAERLARGPMPVDEALDVCRQIAEAFEAAHEGGVVHRDLKPANVKLTPDGKIKVLDFGLAKAMATETMSGVSDTSLSPTMTSAGSQFGMILGTAAYMSPEQARARPLDRRTDLWSFGCVVYECLTGVQLFRGETVSDSLAAILRKDPDWSLLPDDTPPMVRLMLKRCLTRDVRKRLQDAGDARIELEHAIEDPTLGAVPAAEPVVQTTSRGGGWLPWMLVAVSALVAVVAIVVGSGGDGTASEGRTTRRLTIPVSGVTEFGDLAASPPSISPDGSMVIFGVEERGVRKLWLRPLGAFESRPIPGPDGAAYAFWSPDNRHIGFFRGGRLRRIELATGREQPIGEEGSSFPRGASWNARAQIIYAPNSNSGIYVVDAAGGEPRLVTTLDPEISDASHRWPWFLPDGEHFLYTLWTNDLTARDQHAGVYVASLSGDQPPRRIVSDASNAAYAPPGYLVLSRGQSLIALTFDLQTLQAGGEPIAIASGVLGNRSNGHNAFSISQDGTLVYATGQSSPPSTLTWYDRDSDSYPSAVDPTPFRFIRLSPDATQASVEIPGATGDGEIWIVDLVRGVRTRLAYGATTYSYSAWSRDGDRVMYTSQQDGTQDLFVRLADGSGDELPIFLDDTDKELFDWSRDEKIVAYWSIDQGSGTPDVWLYNVERKTSEQLIGGAATYDDARFSPDGGWIAYVSNDSGRAEIFVHALGGEDGMQGGARLQVSTSGGMWMHWRDDGREILYVDLEQRVMVVAIEERDGKLQISTPRELFTIEGTITVLDATSDHQRLLVAIREPIASEPLHVVLDWPAEVAASGTR